MKRYIGIDFGTTNTYLAYCMDDLSSGLISDTLPINSRSSSTTCLLWRKPAAEDTDLDSFGTTAQEEWMQLPDSKRDKYRFVHSFKPNIAGQLPDNLDAYRNARVFLSNIYKFLETMDLDLVRGGIAVIGVPAEIGKDHIDATVSVAYEAGFSKVEWIEEPLGALAFHLNDRSLSLEDAQAGVAVVDFGGGTLDVAMVDTEKGMQKPWGDPTLGGLLFDDLFYQWINDIKGKFLYHGISEEEKIVIWMAECRRIKEIFSNRWASKGKVETFKENIQIGADVIRFEGLTSEEFIRRAEYYTPSELATSYFKRNGKTGRVVSNRPVNLFDWISETLTAGIGNDEVASRPQKVILTGGGGSWPFMPFLVARAFDVDPISGVIKSFNPEKTIGSGLALYLGLRERHKARIATLEAARPASREKLRKRLRKRLDAFAEETAKLVLVNIMREIDEAIWAWHKRGGQLSTLEDKIERICEKKKESSRVLIQDECERLIADTTRLITDELINLLREHHINKDVRKYIPIISADVTPTSPGGSLIGQIVSDFGDLAEAITNVVGGVIAAVLITIKIHLLIGLAIIHPIAAVLVAAGTVSLWLGFGEGVRELAEEQIKKFSFEGVSLDALKLFLNTESMNNKLKRGWEEARGKLSATIKASLDNARDRNGNVIDLEKMTVETFDKVTSLVIANLGVLETVASSQLPFRGKA